ncbi:hypothetical protein EJB05_48432, partial [Eragrostis curvula]
MVAACKDVREAIRRRALLFPVAVAAAVLPPPAPPVLGEVVSDCCTRHCGNISIPFPFGVEPGCYLEPGFNLTCARSHRPPKLFLGDGTVQVLGIDLSNGTVRINGSYAYFPGRDNHNFLGPKPIAARTWSGAVMEGGPYTLAPGRNKLLVEGCNVQVLLEGEPNQTLSTCASLCLSDSNDTASLLPYVPDCSGVACCQANIMTERSSYVFKTVQMNGATGPNSPALAWIVESESNFWETLLDGGEEIPELPAVLDWRINHTTCHGNSSSAACRSRHSFCMNVSEPADAVQFHLCQCDRGYQGNAYIPDGCYDVNECESPDRYPCYGICSNTEGGYLCQCLPGFVGNASVPNGCKVLQIVLGASGVTACLLMLALCGPVIIRRIKLQRVKEKFFRQNKGLLLQQLISRNANISERMIITLRELEKATNNFDRKLVVGGGGHGIVFKELLTRKKPFAYQSEDGDGLITHFMKLLNKGKLIDIIDPQVMEEQDGSVEEVAIIAAMCTKLKGEDRPTMREVEMSLENILVKKLQVPCHTTPWRDDDMQIVSHDFSVIHVTEETSRQYTMEEEILLSAREFYVFAQVRVYPLCLRSGHVPGRRALVFDARKVRGLL